MFLPPLNINGYVSSLIRLKCRVKIAYLASSSS